MCVTHAAPSRPQAFALGVNAAVLFDADAFERGATRGSNKVFEAISLGEPIGRDLARVGGEHQNLHLHSNNINIGIAIALMT